MVVILLMLSVVGILLTPSVEDDVAGTPPVSIVAGRAAMAVESSLNNLEPSSVSFLAFQSELAHLLVSVMRC